MSFPTPLLASGRLITTLITAMTNPAGTWYKFRQILEYLLAGVADYVLFIDCDAFIMMREDHDPVARMVDTMNEKGVDIMVADEDWRGAVRLHSQFSSHAHTYTHTHARTRTHTHTHTTTTTTTSTSTTTASTNRSTHATTSARIYSLALASRFLRVAIRWAPPTRESCSCATATGRYRSSQTYFECRPTTSARQTNRHASVR
jgi:hypothetical protein